MMGRAASFMGVLRLDLCNAPTGGVWPDVGEGGSTTRGVDGSYGEPETTRSSLVLRWTSKLGRCLTRQSKRICSEATTEKAISDKPSKGYIRGVPQRNNEVEMNEVNGVL